MSKHTFSLETLSPIAISQGGSNFFSSSRHFIYDADNHEICFLDPEQVLASVKEANVESAFYALKSSLQSFLKERVGLGEFDIEEMILERLPANGFRINTLDRIYPIQEEQGAPVILKEQLGEAIRAAILYDWLNSEQETGGKKQLEEWVAGIENTYTECRSFLQELKALQDSYRRNPKRLDPYSLERKNSLENQIRDRLESSLKLTDKVLFGEKGADQIKLTASPTFASNAKEIHAIGKVNIENGDLHGILLHEAVKKGTSITFELDLDGKLANPHLAKWADAAQEELTTVLYNYAYDLVEFEREYIDELIQENKYGEGDFILRRNQQENLENLRNFYDNLLEEDFDEASDSQAFLRLRTDSAYLGQTFALALFQQDIDAYERFQVLYGMLPGQSQVTATHTDAVVKLGQRRGRRQDANMLSLLGWVKIQS
jgi:regulator of sigma D